MTVAELRRLLQVFPPEAKVVLYDSDGALVELEGVGRVKVVPSMCCYEICREDDAAEGEIALMLGP